MKFVLSVAFSLALTGCAVVPGGQEIRTKQHMERIEAALQNGDFPLALSTAERIAGSRYSSEFYQLLNDDSTLTMREGYVTELLKYAQPEGNTARTYIALDFANRLRNHGILQNDAQLSDVKTSIESYAVIGNENDSAPFLLSDNFLELPSLQAQEQKRIIFFRSVKELDQHPDAKDTLLVPVMEFAFDESETSSEFKSVAAVLDKMNITRRDNLQLVKRFRPDLVAKLYPNVTLLPNFKISDQQLRDIMELQLKDSESARFQRVSASLQDNGRTHICGQINSKNSYGGYIGYRPFYVAKFEESYTRVRIDSDDSSIASELCNEYLLTP